MIVAYDGVQSLDVTGPAEVFAGANQHLTHQADSRANSIEPHTTYQVQIVSRLGGVVRTESAVRLDTNPYADAPRQIDTLVVAGGFAAIELATNADFVASLSELVERSDRIVSVCTGASLLAATGALDGRRVTTHWARAKTLAERHPLVAVDPDPIYIRDTSARPEVWSSAGVTAGIDLCLALVERDHATIVAQEIARWLVMYLRRPGGQSQFATPSWTRQADDGPIRQVQDFVVANPQADLRVESLAGHAAMSQRHFIRRFTEEVGMPPAKFVAQIRINAARHELERSPDTVAAIAQRCGFGTAETMRRSLQRHLGVSPDEYRQRFAHR